MIIYENTKKEFFNDVKRGLIADKIEEAFKDKHISHNNESEHRSWANSLNFMRNALDDEEISNDCKVAIEYQIPLTAKRVDFLIAGSDDDGNNNLVVVELKQWDNCEPTQRHDVVKAYTGGANRIVCHPSYQAYSYAKVIENFNDAINKDKINLEPCAFLHNFEEKNRHNIEHKNYEEILKLAPVFLQRDVEKLTNFIKKYIKKKDNIDLLMKIDHGKLKPAKSLQDALTSMLKGNQEFYLIDEQKVAYETVKKVVEKSLSVSKKADTLNKKYTVIVEGGPGTGKSVIAIQLLVDLINKGYSANYVTKNAAPRNVYTDKLIKEHYKKGYIKNLFRASDAFYNAPENFFDCLIIDEAHRLRLKSAIFHGENQIKELINCSKVSVFFIDEDQKVTTKDIGSIDEIIKWAKFYDSEIIYNDEIKLVSQFRCNGSDGYLAFLNKLMEFKDEEYYFDDKDYEVRLFNDPCLMREELRKKNEINNKSRMMAGYCYEWESQNNPEEDVYDIKLEKGFNAKWNFANTIWAIDPNSFDQVGCIHTSQGLEFDYGGVIIGNDLRYENNHIVADPSYEAKSDKTSGIRNCKDKDLAKKLIKNTYKTLLSRGQKGCYIYCEDKPLLNHISEMLNIKIEG